MSEYDKYVCYCATDKHIIMDNEGDYYELYECEDVHKITKILNLMNQSIQELDSLVDSLESKSLTVYTVREKKKIVAIFPNEMRAKYYCMEHDANLHYQKERWGRL